MNQPTAQHVLTHGVFVNSGHACRAFFFDQDSKEVWLVFTGATRDLVEAHVRDYFNLDEDCDLEAALENLDVNLKWFTSENSGWDHRKALPRVIHN